MCLPLELEAQAATVLDLVPLPLHEPEEVSNGVGVLDGCFQVSLQHGTIGGLTFTLAEPLNVAHGLLPIALNAMLPAQAVCGGSYLGVVGFGITVVLDLCAPLNGVEKNTARPGKWCSARCNMSPRRRWYAGQCFAVHGSGRFIICFHLGIFHGLSNSNMDCVGGAMAGDSSGWESTSVSAVLGSLSANTLGRSPMTSANTSSRAKSRL